MEKIVQMPRMLMEGCKKNKQIYRQKNIEIYSLFFCFDDTVVFYGPDSDDDLYVFYFKKKCSF